MNKGTLETFKDNTYTQNMVKLQFNANTQILKHHQSNLHNPKILFICTTTSNTTLTLEF